MKLFELKKGDRFKIVSLNKNKEADYGVFLGCDGAFAKVRFDDYNYGSPHQFHNIACYLNVEKIKIDKGATK